VTSEAISAPTRADTASALRNLGHCFVEHDLSGELLERIRSIAWELTGAIRASPPIRRSADDLVGEIPESRPPDGAVMDHFPGCPVSGKDNPMSLAVVARRDGDDVVAHVTFEAACSGIPGFVHGGPVAAVFDDVMGFVLASMNGLSGYTATMTVSFKMPVRIGDKIAPLKVVAAPDVYEQCPRPRRGADKPQGRVRVVGGLSMFGVIARITQWHSRSKLAGVGIAGVEHL